jgi:hypothetical protein
MDYVILAESGSEGGWPQFPLAGMFELDSPLYRNELANDFSTRFCSSGTFEKGDGDHSDREPA